MPQTSPKKTISPENNFSAIGLAWELTGIIVIPLIICLLLGNYLDEIFQSRPMMILIGLLISFSITSYSMVIKLTRLTANLGQMSGSVIRQDKPKRKKIRSTAKIKGKINKKPIK